MPEISDTEQEDASWRNFWVGRFLLDRVQRSRDVDPGTVPDGGLLLALTAALDDEDGVTITAVPTATVTAYVCQESK